jgi:Winged helix DNA-binding domain
VSAQVLDRRALNRALLARQLLLERSSMPPLAAIEHLVGMQAQLPTPPYYGLWTRLARFDPDEVSQLFLDRQVVRIALMRSTVHLVSATDCLALRPVLKQAVERGMTPGSPYGKALVDVDLAELAVMGRDLVERNPLTGQEIGQALQQRWPDVDISALVFAVRALVPLVQVPPRGTWGGVGQSRCTSVEAWTGRSLAEPDVAAMVRRYLAAYGPAGVRDVQAWSGLTGLSRVLKELRPELCTFQDEAGVELFDLPDAPRPSPDTAAPVRLLPDFDGILLSHFDRSRVFTPGHRSLIFTNNGIIRSSVLIDGFVRALWSMTTVKDTATMVVRPLPPVGRTIITKRDQAAVIREGLKLLEFAAPGRTHDVRFEDA